MKAPWSGQLSAAKTGWLVLILFFGWLAFFLVPAPKPKPEPLPAFVVKPPSRLVALGLPDNPDLEHLPEYFAVYENEAEWKNNKTIFAYWNPSSNSYSYFFEVTREREKRSFRLISKFEAYRNMTHEIDTVDESEGLQPSDAQIAAIETIVESPTHPVVLFHSYPVIVSIYEAPLHLKPPATPSVPTTIIPDLDTKAKPLLKVDRRKVPVLDEQKEK